MADARRPAAEPLAPVFAFLWAVCALEDKHYRFTVPGWPVNYSLQLAFDSILLLAATLVLFRPSSRRLFLIFCFAWCINIISSMPEVANDSLLALAVNGILLLSTWRDPKRGLERVAGAVVALLATTYGLAAFHKLNAGFFAAEGSCVASFSGKIQSALSFLPTAQAPLLVATLAAFLVLIEAALAAGLLVPRARSATLLVGTIFHLLLGLTVDSFSTMVLTLYLILLPSEFLPALRARLPWTDRALHAVALSLALLWLGAIYASARGYDSSDYPAFASLRALWFATFALGLAGLAIRGRGLRWNTPRGLAALPKAAWWILALYGFNGLGPYLGFRTTLAFAMFSNLRVEGTSNHFLVPKGMIQLFGDVDDLAEVVRVESPPGALPRKIFLRVPLDGLERFLRRERAAFPERHYLVQYGGSLYSGGLEGKLPDIAIRPSAWKRKFFSFHPAPTTNRCQW